VVVGTRPEAIKLAPVISAMSGRATLFELSVVATAQHRDLLDQMFADLELMSDYDLDLMRDDQGIADYAARSLESLSQLFETTRPEVVVVQGDTTTVMTAALAAQYNGAAVAHVEAGLRSFDLTQPFPEEINRRLASVLATIHFAPTDTARANLLAEGVPSGAVHVTGNTIVDAVRAVDVTTPFDERSLAAIPFESARVVLVTAQTRRRTRDLPRSPKPARPERSRIFACERRGRAFVRAAGLSRHGSGPKPSMDRRHRFRWSPRGGVGSAETSACPSGGHRTARGDRGRSWKTRWYRPGHDPRCDR
jgi:hypothetical protein